MNIKKHSEKIKKKLELEEDLIILIGDPGKLYISELKNDDQPQNGAYTYWNKTVAVVNEKLIGTLAHEMRHAYQYEHRDFYGYIFSKESKPINTWYDKVEYLASRKERDANCFALKYLLFNTINYLQIAKYIFKCIDGCLCLGVAKYFNRKENNKA